VRLHPRSLCSRHKVSFGQGVKERAQVRLGRRSSDQRVGRARKVFDLQLGLVEERFDGGVRRVVLQEGGQEQHHVLLDLPHLLELLLQL